MIKDDIPEIARKNLAEFLDRPGSILYSGHETLKSGDVYLLGFNPGGAGGKSLKASIDSMLSNESNAYLDESWENLSGSWGNGEAPLQKRICWVLASLELNPREVCASNLIFIQSRRASDISYSLLAELCWPIHEAIISVVQPKLIIAFGNSNVSAYGYLHAMLGGIEEYIPSGHGNWNAKGFQSHMNGKAVYVAGLPHLSRYSPMGKSQVVEWLYKQKQIYQPARLGRAKAARLLAGTLGGANCHH